MSGKGKRVVGVGSRRRLRAEEKLLEAVRVGLGRGADGRGCELFDKYGGEIFLSIGLIPGIMFGVLFIYLLFIYLFIYFLLSFYITRISFMCRYMHCSRPAPFRDVVFVIKSTYKH
jgi:hypothetical protein